MTWLVICARCGAEVRSLGGYTFRPVGGVLRPPEGETIDLIETADAMLRFMCDGEAGDMPTEGLVGLLTVSELAADLCEDFCGGQYAYELMPAELSRRPDGTDAAGFSCWCNEN